MSLDNKIQGSELKDDQFTLVERTSPGNIIIKEVYKVNNGPGRTFNIEFTVRKKGFESLTKEDIVLKVKEDLLIKDFDASNLNFDYFVAITTGIHSKVYKNSQRMLGVKEIKHLKVLELLRTLPKYVQNWIQDLN